VIERRSHLFHAQQVFTNLLVDFGEKVSAFIGDEKLIVFFEFSHFSGGIRIWSGISGLVFLRTHV